MNDDKLLMQSLVDDKIDTNEILLRINKAKFVPKHAREVKLRVKKRARVNDVEAYPPSQGIKQYREKRFNTKTVTEETRDLGLLFRSIKKITNQSKVERQGARLTRRFASLTTTFDRLAVKCDQTKEDIADERDKLLVNHCHKEKPLHAKTLINFDFH